jgi:predicted PurR-regulated permease PerM
MTDATADPAQTRTRIGAEGSADAILDAPLDDPRDEAVAAQPEAKVEVVAAGVPRWAVIGIFILLLMGSMAYARAFLMPVVMALLLSMIFSPVRRMFERAGLSSGLSAFLIVGTLVVGLVAGVGALATPVSGWIERAPMIGTQLEWKLRDLRGATDSMREVAAQVDKMTAGEDDPDVQRVVVEDARNAMVVAMTVPSVLGQVAFTLVLLFFLLASGEMFYEKIVYVMPTFKDKRLAVRIVRDIERKLSHYLFTITVINAGLGVAVGLAMWWFGMPNPLLFGVAAFLLNYVPFLGAIIGVAISTVIAILTFPLLGQAAVVGAVYFLLTAIEGQFVTPWFVGRRLQLNTVVVFLSVTLFAWLWSVVGMLVATPLLVMIRTFCEHIPSLQHLGSFLSARGAERAGEEETAPPP